MNSKSFTAGASARLLTLAMLSCLAGCQSILPTLTGGTEQAIADGVCGAWKPVTYSSRDTPETQLEVRANNAAREAYCQTGGS